MSSEESERLGIQTGDVNGLGIVIGHDSSVTIGQALPPAQREAVAMLEDFVRLLGSFEGSVPDASDIREAAEAARVEAGEPSPRWGAVRGLLRGIAASVAGVAALTDAIKNVQDLVAHLSR
jgi:hypothetical protein